MAHTHTHNRLTAFVRDNPGRPVPEETLTHSHPTWSSDILYQLPPFTTINGIILFILHAWQSSWTTSLQVLFGLPLSLGPWTSYSIHFFTCNTLFTKQEAKLVTCVAGPVKSTVDYIMVQQEDKAKVCNIKVISSAQNSAADWDWWHAVWIHER